jgi:hypothetical protein
MGMSNRIPRLLLISVVLACAFPRLAYADETPSDVKGRITAAADDDSAELRAQLRGEGASNRDTTAQNQTFTSRPKTIRTYLPACPDNWPDRGGTVLCPNATQMCAGTPDPNDIGFWVFSARAGATTPESWTATGEYLCIGDADPNEPPPVVPVLTAKDFQRLPLPASPIVVQPPNGRTLVNVPTNLYADSDTVTLPTTILGQPVQVRATPQEFRWVYGDGKSLATEDPGAPYPELRTAHVYKEAGEQRVQLTTVYGGEYSVNGGPWLPVDGVATVVSPGSTLEVVAAENRLVAGGSGKQEGG